MNTIQSDKLDERTRRSTITNPFAADGRFVGPELAEEIVDEDELSPAEHRVLADSTLVHTATKGVTRSSPRKPRLRRKAKR